MNQIFLNRKYFDYIRAKSTQKSVVPSPLPSREKASARTVGIYNKLVNVFAGLPALAGTVPAR